MIDPNLKTDIRDLPDCLELVRRIAPKRYRLLVGPEEERDRVRWGFLGGFLAQEVGEVMRQVEPDFAGHRVGDDELRSETVSINQLLACLWRAVAELGAELAERQGSVGS
jgi:hypothetical protein